MVIAEVIDSPVFNETGLDLGLLILRVVVGLTIAAHGYNHIFRGGKIQGTAGWFASLGMKPGILHAWLASITELVAGVLLVLGLLTPLGAAGVAGTMAVAFVTNHRTNGFFIFRPGEGWEYVNVLMCAGLALGALGPGPVVDRQRPRARMGVGPDRLRHRRRRRPRRRRAAARSVFWRPEKKTA